MELGRVEHMPLEKYFSFVESKTTAAGDPSCQHPNQLSPSIIGEAVQANAVAPFYGAESLPFKSSC